MQNIDIKKMEEDFMGEDEESDAGHAQAVGVEVDLLGNGGIKKKILVLGDGWEQPQKDDKVSVHYTGTLEDGTKFDSSVDRAEPFEFTLGAGQVISGWDKGVATMLKGEKALFTLRSDFAYGEKGSPPRIPANATLLFEIELLSWVSNNDLSPEKDGSILKTVLTEPDIGVWDSPHPRDFVTVKYSATAAGAAEPFVADKVAEFQMSDGHFCGAMNIALEGMKKGEKLLLKVAPKYAFGEAGCAGVPPNSDISIVVELVDIKVVKNVDPDKVGTVVKKTLHAGVNYDTPSDESTVTVSWTGRLADGTEFDKIERAELLIDNDQFPCEGLEMAVTAMKCNEIAEVTIHDASLAFGAAGLPGIVPGDAVVTYVVELHSFLKGKDSWELSNLEKIELAEARKARGNSAFKAGKYMRAQRMYTKAEETISMDKDFAADEKIRAKAIVTSCSLNLAAVALKMRKYRDAITAASKILDKSPGHVKALYRRCQAYTETGDFVEAQSDIRAALLAEPNDRDLLAAQRNLKLRMKTQNKQDAKLFGAMFSKVGSLYAAVPPPSGTVAGAIDEVEEGMDTDAPVLPDVDMEPIASNGV